MSLQTEPERFIQTLFVFMTEQTTFHTVLLCSHEVERSQSSEYLGLIDPM